MASSEYGRTNIVVVTRSKGNRIKNFGSQGLVVSYDKGVPMLQQAILVPSSGRMCVRKRGHHRSGSGTAELATERGVIQWEVTTWLRIRLVRTNR